MTKPRELTRKQARWLHDRARDKELGYDNIGKPISWGTAYKQAIEELTATADDVAALDKEMLELAWDLTVHAPLGGSTSGHAVDILLRLDTAGRWREYPRLVEAVKYAGRYLPEKGEKGSWRKLRGIIPYDPDDEPVEILLKRTWGGE